MNEKAEIDEALAHWPELQDAWQKANTPAAIEESPPIPKHDASPLLAELGVRLSLFGCPGVQLVSLLATTYPFGAEQ